MTFEQYVEQSGDGLLRHAMVITADSWTAQDVVQAVLERALQRWDRIAAMDHPDAYVRRMVVNEFLSLRRRLSRVVLVDQPEDTPDRAADEGSTDRLALIEALRRLPPRQRVAMALRYWGGLSDVEIADQLHCSPATVRSHIWRATRALRVSIVESPLSDPFPQES